MQKKQANTLGNKKIRSFQTTLKKKNYKMVSISSKTIFKRNCQTELKLIAIHSYLICAMIDSSLFQLPIFIIIHHISIFLIIQILN